MCIAAGNIVTGRLAESPVSEYSDPVVTACDVPSLTQGPELYEAGSYFLRLAIPIPNDNGAEIQSYSIAVFRVENTLGLTNSRLVYDEDFDLSRFTPHPTLSDQYLVCELQALEAQSIYSIRYAATNRIGKSEYSAISADMRTTEATVPATLEEVGILPYRTRS